jgi:hypothetical protein
MTVKSFNGIDFEYIFNYNDLGEPISKISNDYSDITLTHDALFKLMKEIADRMGYNITNMQTPTMESITHLSKLVSQTNNRIDELQKEVKFPKPVIVYKNDIAFEEDDKERQNVNKKQFGEFETTYVNLINSLISRINNLEKKLIKEDD